MIKFDPQSLQLSMDPDVVATLISLAEHHSMPKDTYVEVRLDYDLHLIHRTPVQVQPVTLTVVALVDSVFQADTRTYRIVGSFQQDDIWPNFLCDVKRLNLAWEVSRTFRPAKHRPD